MPLIGIGRIGRAHGLRGEVTVHDCPLSAEELQALRQVAWRGRDGDERTLTIEAVRATHDRLLASFRGIADRESAADLALGELVADSARLPDPGPGHTYAFQLIGLAVDTVEGRRLGVLQDILPTGANRVFIVQGEREWLIPATEDVLKRVDLEARVITVALPAGLEDL